MQEAQKQQISHMLCVAITLEAYPAMIRLVEDYPSISASVGMHPNERTGREPTLDELQDLARDPRVVAIGETGLDYFRSEGDLGWQRERFRTHIRAAKAIGKPLIIHTREAKKDTLRILEEERASEIGGVFHCFTEDWETACRAMDMNFYISFSGIVTFKSARVIQDVARRLPEDRFLIETDSPYLAPVPFRGQANYPFYLRCIAECMASLRGVSFADIASASARNFYRLFPQASAA
jgi:TatD DNase family protein